VSAVGRAAVLVLAAMQTPPQSPSHPESMNNVCINSMCTDVVCMCSCIHCTFFQCWWPPGAPAAGCRQVNMAYLGLWCPAAS